MFGPAVGVSNNLALEKIYCMLILRIRAFWPAELYYRDIKKLSHKGGEGHEYPRTTPSYALFYIYSFFWRSSYTRGKQYFFTTVIITIEDTSRYGAYYK